MHSEALPSVKVPRPAIVWVLMALFAFGALMSAASFLSLLLPGGPLESMWQLNPRAHSQLQSLRLYGLVLMTTVSVSCAAAAVGLWMRRLWAYYLSLVILTFSLLGDAANALFGIERRAWIGVPIAGALIILLTRRRTRAYFQ
jgi:hypothetical protein